MGVRIAVRVSHVSHTGRREHDDVAIGFFALHTRENEPLWRYAPRFTMEMTVQRGAKEAIEFFEHAKAHGSELHLDFTEVPAKVPYVDIPKFP